ncbi:MAG: HAD family hydrolase [Clostridia bacterium]|nr:HAD family hydrolase [Clostridia bacterium]
MNETLYQEMGCCALHAMPAKRPVLIVFDLDGTLTDSAWLGRELFKRVFELLGYGIISDELADSFNGPSADEVCRIMGIGEDRKQLYNDLIDEVEPELVRAGGKVFPGTLDMLSTLAQHAALAILTNGSQVYCRTCIETYGFEPYIALESGFVSGVTKAERIAAWERETGVQRVIVVGDRATDISNGQAVGAYTVGVTFGMGTREELASADAICDTTAQVTCACMDVIRSL